MIKDIIKRQMETQTAEQEQEWYKLNSLLGNTWAMYYLIIGGRETGKSYAASEFVLNQFRKYGRRFWWVRLSETSSNKLLQNNCSKLFNAKLRRDYNLETLRVGNDVYEVLKKDDKGKVIKKRKMGTVMALSAMAKDKGVEYYDAGYDGWINIVVDELVRERREANTFDITYNLANQIENIVRSKKQKVRIIMICNMCDDIAEVLPRLNFIPVDYGRYKLKKHKTVIDYLPVTDNYKQRREGAAANILLGMDDGNFNNTIARDRSRIVNVKLKKPEAIIKFSREKCDWFVLWDSKVITRYKGEKVKTVYAMRRYIDEVFDVDSRNNILAIYDAKGFWYPDLVSQSMFMRCLKEVKKT